MNFLALTQKLVEKGGMAGTGPTTVIGQAGEFKRAVGYINEAYVFIQQLRNDWRWMRDSCSFSTVANQASYTPAQCGVTDLGAWMMKSRQCTFRTYVTSVGVGSEVDMTYLGYDEWRNCYQFGAIRDARSRPLVISYAPDQSIVLGQTPDSADYTVLGDYYRAAAEMALDTDVPAMPSQYHMLIVYKALMLYAEFEQDDYLRSVSERNYKTMMTRMVGDQLPEVTFGGALA